MDGMLISPVSQYIQGVVAGWLRTITVNDALPGLDILQSGAGLAQRLTVNDGNLNTVVEVLRVGHTVTGLAAAGIGVALTLYSEDASGNIEEAGRIAASFPTAAHATQTAMVKITALGAADGLSVWSDGTVGIGTGTAAPLYKVHVLDTSKTVVSGNVNVLIMSSDAQAADIGGSLALGGYRDDAGTVAIPFGYIWGRKENSTSGDNAGYLAFGTRGVGTAEHMRITSAGYIGLGAISPATKVEIEETKVIAGATADGYSAALTLDPAYSAVAPQTVTRHNYTDMQDPAGGANVTIIDAAVWRFDANAGTHKAVAAASVKVTPGGVDAWVKINVNGTLHYIPSYLSMVA